MQMKTPFTISVLAIAFATKFNHATAFSNALPAAEIDKTKCSPYPEQNYPNRVFFGDTHLHTSY
jgi:hypothetical protein